MRRRQAVNFRIAGKRKTPSPKSTETYITGCRAAGEGVISLFVVAVGVSGVASDSIVRAVRESFEKCAGSVRAVSGAALSRRSNLLPPCNGE